MEVLEGAALKTSNLTNRTPVEMRAVIQRVSQASVEVEGQIVGQIDGGVLVLLGVGAGDGAA